MHTVKKFTAQQLATLKAEYATTPERLGDESIAKLRAKVAGLPDVLLAQVVTHRVRWLSTLGMTEARKRGLSTERLTELAR